MTDARHRGFVLSVAVSPQREGFFVRNVLIKQRHTDKKCGRCVRNITFARDVERTSCSGMKRLVPSVLLKQWKSTKSGKRQMIGITKIRGGLRNKTYVALAVKDQERNLRHIAVRVLQKEEKSIGVNTYQA